LAKKLAKRGATLILVDINEKWNNVTKDEILADNGVAYAYKCDVSNYDQVKNLAKQIEKNIGNEVTILINNAGVLIGKELLKLSDEEIERLFRINVLSNFWVFFFHISCFTINIKVLVIFQMNKEFLPSMIRNNKGHIVTTASSAGFTGVYRLVDYCTSKHAVYGFHESLTNEIKRLGADKINTTMICPNYTGTGMCDGVTS
jgi:all-trans-retinol dehydrogenase (NAD+)